MEYKLVLWTTTRKLEITKLRHMQLHLNTDYSASRD